MADHDLAFGYTDHPENMPLIEFPLRDTAIDDLLCLMDPHPLAIGALDDLELVDTLTWMDDDAQFLLDFERSLDAEEAVMCGIEDDVPVRIIAANDVPLFGAVVTCKDLSTTTSVLQLLVQSYHLAENASQRLTEKCRERDVGLMIVGEECTTKTCSHCSGEHGCWMVKLCQRTGAEQAQNARGVSGMSE